MAGEVTGPEAVTEEEFYSRKSGQHQRNVVAPLCIPKTRLGGSVPPVEGELDYAGATFQEDGRQTRSQSQGPRATPVQMSRTLLYFEGNKLLNIIFRGLNTLSAVAGAAFRISGCAA
jgi:hypothetical protein